MIVEMASAEGPVTHDRGAARAASHRLSAGVAVLMAAASAAGLARPALYRDNPLVVAGWLGNDAVNLLGAVPALVAALVLARRGSTRAELVRLGVTAYAVYAYAFYLFGAALNPLFLLYAAVLAAGILALGLGLGALEVEAIPRCAGAERGARRVGAFLLVVVGVLGALWVAVSLQFVITGEPPAIVVATGGVTNLAAALDLTLVVPLGALAGLLLRRSEPWGVPLAVVWITLGGLYMTALAVSTINAARVGAAESATQAWLWAGLGIGCALSLRTLAHGVPSR